MWNYNLPYFWNINFIATNIWQLSLYHNLFGPRCYFCCIFYGKLSFLLFISKLLCKNIATPRLPPHLYFLK